MPSSKKAKEDWARHRQKITRLWSREGKELPEVMEMMIKDHGFDASEKAYKRQFKKWDLDHKKVRTPTSKAILGITERRRRENKATFFKHYDKLVEPKNVQRFYRRYKTKINPNFVPDVRAATPPNVTYGTPEPDMLKYAIAPVSLSYSPRQGLRGEERESMGNTPGSHYFDGDGSSHTGTVPWEASPESFSGPSGDPYSGTAQRSQTNMPANFQNTLPRHQPSYGLDAFAQTDASSRFPPQPWAETTEPPSHAYHTPGYGNSWAPHPQPPQPLQQAMHSVNPGPSALAFPDHGSQGLGYGHGVIGTVRFDNENPNQTTMGIPGAPSSNLEYMPLYHAIVGSDINTATALLQDGADPNSAAHGGVTPLHCAAYQKNINMVRLLLNHGANLEARTDKDQSVLFFAVCGQGQSCCIDMPGYGIPTPMGNGFPTDDRALRTMKALFECPTRFALLHENIDKPDKYGVTPLMVAAGEGFRETATMLLIHRAQRDQRDYANHTALKYAATNNHRDIVRLLLDADPAVSYNPNVSHILKLASKNIAGGHGGSAHRSSRERRYNPAEVLIAEEIVWQCQKRGVLDQLLLLAKQERKTGVFDCLRRVMAQPGSEGSHAAGS